MFDPRVSLYDKQSNRIIRPGVVTPCDGESSQNGTSHSFPWCSIASQSRICEPTATLALKTLTAIAFPPSQKAACLLIVLRKEYNESIVSTKLKPKGI
jgi:hypothetical protein